MKIDPTYKKWYSRRRAHVLRMKRDRYRNDPDYREKVRKQARSYWRKNRMVSEPADRTIVKSQVGIFFSIGRIANLTKLSQSTIRKYHKSGVLPETTHIDTRGWRLYTRDQADLLRVAFRMLAEKELESLSTLSEYVARRWLDGEK